MTPALAEGRVLVSTDTDIGGLVGVIGAAGPGAGLARLASVGGLTRKCSIGRAAPLAAAPTLRPHEYTT